MAEEFDDHDELRDGGGDFANQDQLVRNAVHNESQEQLNPADVGQRKSSKKRRRMFCSHCNRMENHRRDHRKSWLKSYVTGLMFGLNYFLGPFKCSCCGGKRWIIAITKSGIK